MVEWHFPNRDALNEAKEVLDAIHHSQETGQWEEVERLKQHLTSLPGFPETHQPGERVELVFRPVRLYVPRGTSPDPRKARAILDTRKGG